MSLWPFHHKKKTNIASVSQQLQGVQLQSAAAAIAIPIVYGQAKVAGNLIHYKDLVGGTVEALLISLTHAVIAMGICEGPISDIIHVWYDRQSRTVAGAGGLTVFTGTLSQAAWGFLTTNFPSEAVTYELTAYVASSTWPLKEGGSLPNFTWEVRGFLQWNYPTILDSNPKDVITDFLTDANHGALFPAAQIGSLTAFRDYCTAAGIFLSPAYTTQAPAAQHVQELLALANTAPVWSDGLLKMIPYGDTAITGNGATFTPNVTPVYNLTDDDFIVSSGEDPVRCTRVPLADAYNHIQLQFENRAKDYNIDIAEAKDQTSIELDRLRTAPVMNAPQIKDAAVARLVVQLALQRQVFIRNTYEFDLPLRYVLLEPMDLVTLTDANLGLNQTPVRLTKIEEQDDSTFLCTAEEWPFGVATAAAYPVDTTVPYAPNVGSSTNPPVIAVSFDSTGQAILNLIGDKKTVEHLYVIRTDRLPTLAETRAGTAVNVQTPAPIATGVVVAPGSAVYVGDLTYNTWGDESALVTGQFTNGYGRDFGAATLVASANISLQGNTAVMTGGTAWNEQVYSRDGCTGGAFASALIPAGDSYVMFGLNTDPTTDANYTSIDFAIEIVPGGTTNIYESGVYTGISGTWAANDVFAVVYDGSNVRYMQNGTVIRTVFAGPAIKFFFDSSFNNTSSKLVNIRFGPLTNVGPTSGYPVPAGSAIFSFNSGGPANAKMWIAFTWSTILISMPDGSTINIPASSSLPVPPTPTLSQVASGALGARTLFARIGYIKNNMIMRVGAEASLAVLANNVLKITSPAAIAGYDSWVALVGSSSNGEFIQAGTLFGTNYQESSVGFNSTTTTPYDNTNMPSGVTAYALQSSSTYWFYPFYDLLLGIIAFDGGNLNHNSAGAATQNLDGRIPMSLGGSSAVTPAATFTSAGTTPTTGRLL